jgi:hypothetical protein
MKFVVIFFLSSPLSFFLNFGHQVFKEVDVVLFAGVDALAQRGRQGMVFVEHHRDLAVARAEHDFNVQPDEGAQPLFGIGNADGRD